VAAVVQAQQGKSLVEFRLLFFAAPILFFFSSQQVNSSSAGAAGLGGLLFMVQQLVQTEIGAFV
jgi:hypothetical protein